MKTEVKKFQGDNFYTWKVLDDDDNILDKGKHTSKLLAELMADEKMAELESGDFKNET